MLTGHFDSCLSHFPSPACGGGQGGGLPHELASSRSLTSSSTSSRFISTSRDLLPSYGPMTRWSASWSTIRAARVYPTLSLRCSNDTEARPSVATTCAPFPKSGSRLAPSFTQETVASTLKISSWYCGFPWAFQKSMMAFISRSETKTPCRRVALPASTRREEQLPPAQHLP